MTKAMNAAAGVLVLLACAAQGFSQEEKNAPVDPKFYHLDFMVKELEGGKVTNARNYSLMVSTARNTVSSSVRATSKVPVVSGSFGQETANTQFSYQEVGVNIDCRAAKELPDRLALTVTASIDGATIPEKGRPALIRRVQWSGEVMVPLRKATTIFLSDDAGTKVQMQLEVTANLIK